VRRLTDVDLPHLRYHGSYVAAGLWTRSNGTQALLASVHASPSYAEPERYGWPREASQPKVRNGGEDPRWPNDRLWDSDFVLVTLHALGELWGLPLLAAGDLNESLLDDPPRGTWASEFFDNAVELGLDAWLHNQWKSQRRGELSTRAGLQLDHVLVRGGGENLLSCQPPPQVDPQWSRESAARDISDHAAIWFALAD